MLFRSDADYERFVRQTGFQFERDLDRVSLGIARGPDSKSELPVVNALLEGRFDQMRAALDAHPGRADRRTQQGHAVDSYDGPGGRRFRISFLSGDRLAFSNSAEAAPMDRMIGLWEGDRPGLGQRLEELGVFQHVPAGAQAWAALDMEKAPGLMSLPAGAISPGTSLSADLLRGSRMVLLAAHASPRDLELRLVARCAVKADARRVADSLAGIRALLSAMAARGAPGKAPSEAARALDSLKIEVAAETALVRWTVDNATLERWMNAAALPAAAGPDRKSVV